MAYFLRNIMIINKRGFLMNKKTLLTIGKSVALILILIAFVFALRAPAADLNILPDEVKGEYVDSYGLPYFSEMDSYYN